MSEAVLVALIAACVPLIGVLYTAKKQSDAMNKQLDATLKEMYSELDKRSELNDARIHGEIDVIKTELQTLREEVQKHNKVIERTYELEKTSARHDEQIKTLFNKA